MYSLDPPLSELALASGSFQAPPLEVRLRSYDPHPMKDKIGFFFATNVHEIVKTESNGNSQCTKNGVFWGFLSCAQVLIGRASHLKEER
jgi:hypothetical protein